MTSVGNVTDNAILHMTKMAELTKNQQQAEGEIALELIQASTPAPTAQPIGNLGQNINTTA